jgi:hypothetical protein
VRPWLKDRALTSARTGEIRSPGARVKCFTFPATAVVFLRMR